MLFGVCISVEQSAAMQAAGWDFVEENVQGLLQGNLPDGDWKGPQRLANAALPVLAANCLVPGAMKITGPDVRMDELRGYMQTVLRRAEQLGVKTLVFGSGGARRIPDGFDRDRARRQMLDSATMAAELAGRHGVVLVAEPLNRKECNVLNSVPETLACVREVSHPNFQCLVDSYHFWAEKERLEDLRPAVPWVRHVHVANDVDRTAPGHGGNSPYRAFFRVLKQGGYAGPISVEATGFVPEVEPARKVLEYLRNEWENA